MLKKWEAEIQLWQILPLRLIFIVRKNLYKFLENYLSPKADNIEEESNHEDVIPEIDEEYIEDTLENDINKFDGTSLFDGTF